MRNAIELVPFKETTPRPQDGDVFCFQAKGSNTMYGQVIRWVKVGEWDGILVRIFSPLEAEGSNGPLPFSETLLLPPIILDPMIWKRKLISVVPSCVHPVSAKERYTFWDPTEGEYVDEMRKTVKRPGKAFATYGLTTLTGFCKELKKAMT